MTKPAGRKKTGRPKIGIDYAQVAELAAIQCTDAEMAAVLGISLSTLKNRKGDDLEFLAAYEKGKEDGKCSLRRLQWGKAREGNVTMMIWLGKQYLGQSDKVESHQDVTVTDRESARARLLAALEKEVAGAPSGEQG